MLKWPIWIGVVCDDLEGQRRFYRDVLHLKDAEDNLFEIVQRLA